MKLGDTGYAIYFADSKKSWKYNFGYGWKQAINSEQAEILADIHSHFRSKASYTEADYKFLQDGVERVISMEKTSTSGFDFSSTPSEVYEKYSKSVKSKEKPEWTLKTDDSTEKPKSKKPSEIKKEKVTPPPFDPTKIPKQVIQKFIDFFSEFHFEPNFRFINTFALCCMRSDTEAVNYISNYFKLADSPYHTSIIEKMKSFEFTDLVSRFKGLKTSKKINTRFKLYYGSQGTGKTTKAIEEASECMVCHSAMLPQDLMEDFKFVDGHPDFQPSVLQQCMVEGKAIVLDEINLLPFESLRFLQSILDGKKEISYKGKTIRIADGFMIIGTMNLVVNGCTFSLPEPLIDRAFELREFSLKAEDLVGALI